MTTLPTPDELRGLVEHVRSLAEHAKHAYIMGSAYSPWETQQTTNDVLRLAHALESRLPEPASEDLQVRVARVIAPSAFYRRRKNRLQGDVNPADRSHNRERLLAKADAILSIVLPQEGGWRPMPVEPTEEMLAVIAHDEFPADWEAGKIAQRRGEPVPFKTEYEIAYGQYKRLLALSCPPPAPQPVGGEGLRK